MGNNLLLTEEQKTWMETRILTLNLRPKLALIRHKSNWFRQVNFDIAVSKFFEMLIYATISANTLLMTIKWPGMSTHSERIIETVNYIFTCLFICEAAIKLTAFGTQYFRDSWNVFDFFIVTISVLFIALKELF